MASVFYFVPKDLGLITEATGETIAIIMPRTAAEGLVAIRVEIFAQYWVLGWYALLGIFKLEERAAGVQHSPTEHAHRPTSLAVLPRI